MVRWVQDMGYKCPYIQWRQVKYGLAESFLTRHSLWSTSWYTWKTIPVNILTNLSLFLHSFSSLTPVSLNKWDLYLYVDCKALYNMTSDLRGREAPPTKALHISGERFGGRTKASWVVVWCAFYRELKISSKFRVQNFFLPFYAQARFSFQICRTPVDSNMHTLHKGFYVLRCFVMAVKVMSPLLGKLCNWVEYWHAGSLFW